MTPNECERIGMYNTHITDHGLRQVLRTAKDYPWRWMLPTLLIGGLGLAYAWVHQPDWQASQALTIREQSADNAAWSGRFNEAEELKHTQETMLELAKSPPVISAALNSVGPPASCQDPQHFPSPQDVAAVRDKTDITSPHGAEFGTTRMFYLNVSQPDPQRTVQLVSAICDEAEKRFKKLREQEGNNSIAELSNTASLAQQELDRKTSNLRQMETSAGSDLAELRMLSESFSGGSNLQTTLSEVRQELRQVENTFHTNQQLLSLLTAAQDDPSSLVATPNRLLDAQPALRRLKDGLIDAQLASSQLMGTMSPDHPRVKAAMVAETEIRGHLHRELEVAVRGLGAEQALVQTQLTALTQKAEDLQQRLRKLAEMRAAYSNQLIEVRQQTESLSRAQQELNAARAALAADEVTSLVTRVDAPQTGPYPQGPPRSVIAAVGLAGGLLVGLGLLLLSTPSHLPTVGPSNETASSHRPTSLAPMTPPSAPAPSTPVVPELYPAPECPLPEYPVHPLATPPLPAPATAGHSLTLKEALMRCSRTSSSETSNLWN